MGQAFLEVLEVPVQALVNVFKHKHLSFYLKVLIQALKKCLKHMYKHLIL